VDAVKPYTEWTADELREELRARQLKVSGNQPELIARLEEHDQAEADREGAAAGPPGDRVVTHNADGSTTTTTDGHVGTTVDADGDDVTADADRDGAAVDEEPDLTRSQKVEQGVCVVDDGTPHTGRAVNGVICSAHAMRYNADGKPR
jgi:hypothetical protein